MTAADVAYRGIHQMLASGQLLPGQRLSQSRLARQLQCSPMPVVEAMRRLESEGLLDKTARKQARVRKLSREDLDGLYLLREAIETVIARLAAERINSEESQTLQELARTYERAWEGQDHEAEADVAIHRHIAQCARCPLLRAELERFRLIELTAGRHLRAELTRPGHPHIHRALVQAIVDHDAASAEYLMKKHIQQGYDEARREIDIQLDNPPKTRRRSSPRRAP